MTASGEGAASAHIVMSEGVIVTRPLSNAILHGNTRATILGLASADGIPVTAGPFTIDEAKRASEAIITSATNFALPVVSIEGTSVGSGRPGPIAGRLKGLYVADGLATAI